MSAQAAGSPYLLGEVALQAREGWAIRTVDEAIHARISTLDPEARRLLEAAAITELPESPTFLGRVAGLDQGAWEAAYRLRALRLLRSPGQGGRDRVELHHDHVGRVVLAGLPAERRRALHGRAAGLLDARLPSERARRARHLLGADRGEEAAEAAHGAGLDAEAALAFEAAVEHHRQAAALAPSALHFESLARACVLAGHLTAAGEAFLAAADHAGPDRADDLRRDAGSAFLQAGEMERGLGVLAPLLAALGVKVPDDGAAATREGLWLRLRFSFFGGGKAGPAPDAATRRQLDLLWAACTGLSMLDPQRADTIGLRHLLAVHRHDDPSRVARALAFEASNLALVGISFLTDRARALAARAEQLAAASQDPRDRAWALLGRSSVAGLLGEFRASAEHGLEAERLYLAHARGVDWELMVLRTYINGSLAHLGEVRTLCERVPAGLEDALRRGHLLAATIHRAGQPALAWLWLDRPGVVLDEEAVPPSAPGVRLSALGYFHLLATTRALLYRGDAATAKARLAAAWADLAASGFLGFPYTRLEMYLLRLQVAAALGEVGTLPRPVARAGHGERAVRHAGAVAAASAALGDPRPERFVAAAAAFTAEGHAVAAAAARWRAATLAADAAGAQAELDAAHALGIVSPEAYFRSFLPVPR